MGLSPVWSPRLIIPFCYPHSSIAMLFVILLYFVFGLISIIAVSPSLSLVTRLMTSFWTAVFLRVHFSSFSTLLKRGMYLTDMVNRFTCSLMINRPLPLAEWARSTLSDTLAVCAEDVAAWCVSRRLQFNAKKTKLIWFGSRANLSRLSGRDLSITFGSETIKSVNSVRDLGFRLDSELSMKHHINAIARTRFCHLRRLRQIRRRTGYEVTVRLVLALIMSRIDYCNAPFAGLPASTIAPLQRVQNAAALLVLQLGPRDHITQGLRGATENARPDIARPSKLWGLTSRDWTTWDHVARVDIAGPDNAAPDRYIYDNVTSRDLFQCWSICSLISFFCYYKCYTNCRYQFVLIVLVMRALLYTV